MIFDPDPSLGFDPDDAAKAPRRLGDFLDSDSDVFLVYRQYSDAFEDGYRDVVLSQGIWENVTVEQVDAVLVLLSGEVS